MSEYPDFLKKKADLLVANLFEEYRLLDEDEVIEKVNALVAEDLFELNEVTTINDLDKRILCDFVLKRIKVELLGKLSDTKFWSSEKIAYEYLLSLLVYTRDTSSPIEEKIDCVMSPFLIKISIFSKSNKIAELFSAFLVANSQSGKKTQTQINIEAAITSIYENGFSGNKIVREAYNYIIKGIVPKEEKQKEKKERFTTSKNTRKELYQIIKNIGTDDLSESTDTFISGWFEILKEYYDYLNKDSFQLITINSSAMQIYTIRQGLMRAIVWDTNYIDYFFYFTGVISKIAGFHREDSVFANENIGLNDWIYSLLKKTCSSLDSILLDTNPDEKEFLESFKSHILGLYDLGKCCDVVSNEHNERDCFFDFAKFMLLFHEVEHILVEEENIESIYFDSFVEDLLLYKNSLGDFSLEGFSIDEQRDRIELILSKSGKWKGVFKELGTDHNAFYSAIIAIHDNSNLSWRDVIVHCICGSKLVALFQTYRNITSSLFREIIMLKSNGIVNYNDARLQLMEYIKSCKEEIVFRDVLLGELQTIVVKRFKLCNDISNSDYSTIIDMRNAVLEAYQAFIGSFLDYYQILAITELIGGEDNETSN